MFSVFSEVIKVGSEKYYPPYVMVDNENNPIGFSIELLNAALDVMNIDYTYRLDNWNIIKKALENGEIDVLPVVGRTPVREDKFDFTFPYLTMHGTIIVNKNSEVPHSIEDLRNKTIGVMEGDNAEEYVRTLDLNLNVVLTESFENALLKLSNGEIDAVIIQRYLAHQIINDLNIENLKFSDNYIEDFKQSFSFAVTEGNDKLLEKLNEGLSIVMINGTFNELQTKWFSAGDKIRNSGELIIVGGENNYPPYEYIDENGEPAGYNVDLTRAIAKEMNLNIHIQLEQRSEILKKLYSGEVDLLQGLYYSKEQYKDITFSQAHSIIKHVIIERKNNKKRLTNKDLQGLNIIIQKDDIIEEYLQKNNIKASFIRAKDYEEALEYLSSGLGDCAILSQTISNYWIKKNRIKNLLVGDNVIFAPGYSYGALKLNQKLIMPFKEGLSIIKLNGIERDIFTKWISDNKYTKMFNFINIQKIFIYIILPVLILLLLVFIWLQSLNSQIKIRTKELKISELKLDYIMNSISSFVFVIDINGKIVQYNNACTLNLDLGKIHIKGSSYKIFQFLRNIDMSKMFIYCKEPNSDNSNQILQKESYIDENGNTKWVQIVIKPIDEDIFGIPVIIGTSTDITTLVGQQDINISLQHQLLHKSKMDAVGQLAGGISHDFNNVLSGIINAAQLIKITQKYLDANGFKYLDLILKASSHAESLVKKLLSFSNNRIEEENDLDMHKMIMETQGLLKETIDKKITLKIELNALEFNIFGNEPSIHSCLINICINANHAMKAGGNLTIRTTNTQLTESQCNRIDFDLKPGNYIQLQVIDSGTGMPQNVVDRIFEPFFTTKKKDEGTGLGLAAVYNTIKSHKGLIEVDSNLGHGTTFSLYFPLSEKHQQKDLNVDLIESGAGLILFIDDEEINRDLGEDVLESLGYKVLLASDGFEAIKIYKEYGDKIDLIILDFMMPKMDGKETFIKLKEINDDIKVILSTGYSDTDAIDYMKEHGLNSVIKKPYQISELSSLIKKNLG